MTTLTADFTMPDYGAVLTPGAPPVGRCKGIPWNFGSQIDLAKLFPQTQGLKLCLVSTNQSVNNRIYLAEGLVLETNRSASSTSLHGEGIGIAFDIAANPTTTGMRIEVEFDYVAVATDPYDPKTNLEYGVDIKSTIPSHPPTGLKLAVTKLHQLIKTPLVWLRDDLSGVDPRTTRPFFGTVSAFCTAEDLTTQTIEILKDRMATAVVQLSYDPADSGKHVEQIRIAVPTVSGTPTPTNTDTTHKMSFPFFVKDFLCPIKKVWNALYNLIGEPWTGNPKYSFFFQVAAAISGKNSPNDEALVGMRLLRARTASGDVLDELNGKAKVDLSVQNGPPDISKYKTELFRNQHFAARLFAGVSIQIGQTKTTTPTQSYGPARLRIKRLLVEYS